MARADPAQTANPRKIARSIVAGRYPAPATAEGNVLAADLQFAAATLSPDDRWCAGADWTADQVYIFDTSSGGVVRQLPACTFTSGLLFSPDNRWLVMCGVNEYRFWETARWQVSCLFSRNCNIFPILLKYPLKAWKRNQ